MAGFKKRSYQNLREFMQDLGFILKNQKRIRTIFKGKDFSPAFRERMMLAVTHVNNCRYCASFHTKAAMAEDISREEVNAFLNGRFDDCPQAELTGVLYAEHWAESMGKPDAEIRDKLISEYGQEKADDIDLVLGVIKTGNCTMNSIESLLHKISFGRWGT